MPLPIGVFGDFLSHHILMKEVACMELERLRRKPGCEQLPLCARIYDRHTHVVIIVFQETFQNLLHLTSIDTHTVDIRGCITSACRGHTSPEMLQGYTF